MRVYFKTLIGNTVDNCDTVPWRLFLEFPIFLFLLYFGFIYKDFRTKHLLKKKDYRQKNEKEGREGCYKNHFSILFSKTHKTQKFRKTKKL